MANAQQLSDELAWKQTHQKRLEHSVDKAIAIITKAPRPVQEINPADWRGNCDKGKCWVRCSGGPPNFWVAEKLPTDADDSFPVLVGVRKGQRFLLDGAHRLVRAKINGVSTIKTVFLTEAETHECAIAGKEKEIEAAFSFPVDHW